MLSRKSSELISVLPSMAHDAFINRMAGLQKCRKICIHIAALEYIDTDTKFIDNCHKQYKFRPVRQGDMAQADVIGS